MDTEVYGDVSRLSTCDLIAFEMHMKTKWKQGPNLN